MQDTATTTRPWLEDLFEFGWFPDRDDRLGEPVGLAEQEDWDCQQTESDYQYPSLFNYVRYTCRRVAEENKIALSDDGQYRCFKTYPAPLEIRSSDTTWYSGLGGRRTTITFAHGDS